MARKGLAGVFLCRTFVMGLTPPALCMLGDDKADFLKQGFAVLKSNFPGTLTINGTAYNVARSAIDHAEQQDVGGFDPESTVAVRMLVEDHNTEPELEVAVDLDAETMRIKRVIKDPGGVTWYLELQSA